MPSVSHPLPSPLHFLLYIAPSDSSPCAPFPLSHFHTVSLLLNSAPPFTSPHFTPFTPHSCLFTSPSYTLVSYSPFFHCLALIFLTFPPAALPFLPISPHLCFALPYIWAAVLPSSHSLSLSLSLTIPSPLPQCFFFSLPYWIKLFSLLSALYPPLISRICNRFIGGYPAFSVRLSVSADGGKYSPVWLSGNS